MQVPSKFLSHIVGRGGSKINDIRALTDTRIDIRKSDEKKEFETVVLTGAPANCKEAKQMILDIIKEQEEDLKHDASATKRGHQSAFTKTIPIPSEAHSYIIGPRGSRIKDILDRVVTSFNDSQQVPEAPKKPTTKADKKRKGSNVDDASKEITEDKGIESRNFVSVNDVRVNFPKAGADSADQVQLKAPHNEILNLLEKEMTALVLEHKSLFSRTTIEFSVPAATLENLVQKEQGKNKSRVERLQSKYRVDIQVPIETASSDDVTLKVVGKEKDCEKVKQELLVSVECFILHCQLLFMLSLFHRKDLLRQKIWKSILNSSPASSDITAVQFA
jgi:predicted PilT family ATPase